MMTNKINLTPPKIVFILIILFFTSLYFLKAYSYLHIDFGWYIREGELILKGGIAKTDLLSYSMSSYSYINHEWLSHVLIYFFYSKVGLALVSGLFVLVAVASILIQVPKRYLGESIFPVVISFSTLYVFFGTRVQIIGWLFFSILVKIYFDQNLWLKWRKFVPLMMLLWVNLHGSYFLGISLLIYFLIVDIFKKRLSKNGFVIYALSIFVTLINPYSYLIWWEILRQFFDTNMRSMQGEWAPFYSSFSFFIAIYFIFTLTLVYLFRKKISNEYIVLILVLLVAAVSSIRNIPFYIIAVIPVVSISLNYLNSKKSSVKREAFRFFLLAFLGLFLVNLRIDYLVYKDYTEDRVYPKEALKYLKENLPEKEIFTIYEWGGYLDWKLPEKKVFIDGRMTTWAHNGNFENESNFAYKDYEKLFSGELNLKDFIDKYEISTILYHSQAYLPENLSDPFYSEIDALDNWGVVYSDGVAIIYQSKKEQ